MSGSVLVVAAHPDDDVLGCGGTLARWATEGRRVVVAFLTDGVGARGTDHAAGDRRRAAAEAAGSILGLADLRFAAWPDNQLDRSPLLEIVRHVEQLVAELRPDTVLTHHAGDLNVDHRRACQAVVTACRPQPGHPVRTLWSFEVASSTEWQIPSAGTAFLPSTFVDISASLGRKLEALDAYHEELRDWPHARSRPAIEALARWRGATVGVEAAEAFVVQRAMT